MSGPPFSRAVLAALLAASLPRCSPAQDFAPAAAAGPQPGPLAFLDRALPCGPGALALDLSVTRWLALASLETRAAALEFAPGIARVACGASQTGEPALGWTSVALAAGASNAEGGAALRAVARLDRATGEWDARRMTQAGGIEAGAGAWLSPSRLVAVWASAPQLWLAGASPPLLRPAELGARATGAGIAAWAAILAPRRGDEGERAFGLSLGRPPLLAWGEIRDGPLRGTLGVRASARALVVEARVDAHPVLGETTRIAFGWRGAGSAAP